jgi:geranylgeranyl pyrophosphate synthase
LPTPSSDQTQRLPAAEFVDSVEAYLHRRLQPRESIDGGILEEAASHLTLAGGAKRARPRLVAYIGRALDVPDSELVPLAAAGELVHTASLLHDDVIDAGTERRGRETVNVKWNNTVAILGGDLLLTTSLAELRPYPRPVTNAAIEVVEQMTRALMLEADSHGSTDMTLEQWRGMAAGKTGELFGWCMSAPARVLDRPSLADRLEECGRRLGIAFQIADDMRDLVDPDSGKDRYNDLRNGAPSYVLLAAIHEDETLRQVLGHLWAGDMRPRNLESLAGAIVDSGALDQARSQLAEEVQQALDALAPLTDCTNGQHVVRWAHELCSKFGVSPPDDTRSEEAAR